MLNREKLCPIDLIKCKEKEDCAWWITGAGCAVALIGKASVEEIYRSKKQRELQRKHDIAVLELLTT